MKHCINKAQYVNIGGKFREVVVWVLVYIVLSEEDRRLLLQTRRLLDELLETLDILSNPEELKALEESEKEMKEGKLTPLDDLIHELETKKVQS